MKYIAMATEKRIEKMKKDDVLFPLGYFFKDVLEKQKEWCGCYSCNLKRDSNVENEIHAKIYPLPDNKRIAWSLNHMFPELVSPTICLDLCSVTIYDFNKLVRLVEMKRPDFRIS